MITTHIHISTLNIPTAHATVPPDESAVCDTRVKPTNTGG